MTELREVRRQMRAKVRYAVTEWLSHTVGFQIETVLLGTLNWSVNAVIAEVIAKELDDE